MKAAILAHCVTALAVVAILALPSSKDDNVAYANHNGFVGDVDCGATLVGDGGTVSVRDGLAILRYFVNLAALPVAPGCPDIGSVGIYGLFGDLDCSGGIAPRDVQVILRYVLRQSAVSQNEPCPDIGELESGAPTPTPYALQPGNLAGEVYTSAAVVSPGGSVTIDLTADLLEFPDDPALSPDLGSYEVRVNYDKLLVTATSCSSAIAACNVQYDSDTVAFAGVTVSPGLIGTFSLGTITFQAGNLLGTAALDSVAILMTDREGRPFVAGPGHSEIAVRLVKGDFDCDGDVDTTDISMLGRFLSRGLQSPPGEPCPDFGKGAGDLNCDGVISRLDFVYLRTWINGRARVLPGCPPIGS